MYVVKPAYSIFKYLQKVFFFVSQHLCVDE